MNTNTHLLLPFNATKTYQPTESQQATIREAIGILESRLCITQAFDRPADVKQFLYPVSTMWTV